MTWRAFFAELRAQGFIKAFDSRCGGTRVAQWEHTFGDRKVEVQFWADGEHRVSHFLKGRMSTYPTRFSDVPSMKRAIRREIVRTDHPPVQGIMKSATGDHT